LGNACFVCVDDGRFDPQNRLGLGDPPLAPFPGCGSGCLPTGGGASAYHRLMAWIPPGSPGSLVRRGVKELVDRCSSVLCVCVKRAQRPVLRHVSRSMDLRSVRNRNRRHTLREPVLLHPHPPRPLLPPAGEGEPSSCGFCKKSWTIPARLANRFDRKIKPLDGFRPVGLALMVCLDTTKKPEEYLTRYGAKLPRTFIDS
jgi:hypothetical protein